ncbi:MAG TPA: type IV pilin protein [Steroidobacteraceae bacterium]|jgi:type IV pilus assembly protein PilE
MIIRTHTHGRDTGFTLVELMVVVVIASILLAIAVPSYISQVRKSRRTEARNAVLDLAAREERFLSTANIYSRTPSDLGYGGAFPQAVGSGYYNVDVPAIAAPAAGPPPAPAQFTVTATALGTQLKDTNCKTFTINQLGQQSSTNSAGADSTATCWN